MSDLELSGSTLVNVAQDKVSDSYPGLAEKIQSELDSAPLEASQAEVDEINDALEATVDVPLSGFWDNAEEPEQDEQPVSLSEADEQADVPQSGIISFKANGEERQMTLEEASKKLDLDASTISQIPQESLKRALAKVVGSERAFTKLAQTTKEMKDLQSKLPELEKRAQLLDKLEEIKHDPKLLLNLITGQDYDSFMQDQIRRYEIMKNGSEADKKALEREERLAALERRMADEEDAKAEAAKLQEQKAYESEKGELKGLLESEFFKHQFDLGDDADSNDVNEILWERGQRQLSRYVKKYQDHPKFKELLPKMVQKAFEDEAGKLRRLTTKPVQAKVDEVIAKKRQKAAEQAQVSAGRANPQLDMDNFQGKSIRDIANMLTGSKKFSF